MIDSCTNGLTRGWGGGGVLPVEYAERGKEYGVLFIVSLFCVKRSTGDTQTHTDSLFCEYIYLECVRIHVIYRVNQAECVIYILVVGPQEFVNIPQAEGVLLHVFDNGSRAWG